MIQWHKCSEKMPEIDKEIIVFNPTTGYVHKYKPKTFGKDDNIRAVRIVRRDSYWAYASDFSFPETKDK